MAIWLKRYAVDLHDGNVRTMIQGTGTILQGASNALQLEVAVTEGGVPADLSGWTISGEFTRQDGTRIPVTGSAQGNVASVVMERGSASIPGRLVGDVWATRGQENVPLIRCVWEVLPTGNGPIMDVSAVIPSLQELLNAVRSCQTAANSANTQARRAEAAAADANESAEAANAAATAATDAANTANEKATLADQKAMDANNAASAANTAAGKAETNASLAQEKANAAEAMSEKANAAAEAANVIVQDVQEKLDNGQFAAIDDTVIVTTNPWSSKKTVDSLCQPFEETGNPVQCYPVEGYPLGVKVRVDPVQHFDWVSKSAISSQVTTTGKNLWANGDLSFTDNEMFQLPVPIPAGEYTISCVFDNDSTDYNDGSFHYFSNDSHNPYGYFLVKKGQSSTTVTFAADIVGIIFCATDTNETSADVSAVYKNIQIEAGSTATAYEPYTGGKASPSPEYPQEIVDSIPAGSYYVASTAPEGGYWKITLDEKLGGVNDNGDTIEIDQFTGRYRVLKNTAEIILDGTESWAISGKYLENGSDYYYQINTVLPDITDSSHTDVLCTHYPSRGIVNNGTLQGVDIVWRIVRIRWGEEMALSEWTTYLAEQYNQGTPITIQYPTNSSVITTGQAEHVTSASGLTALETVSMSLIEPDPDHPCMVTTLKSVQLRRTGMNVLNYNKVIVNSETVRIGMAYLVCGETYTITAKGVNTKNNAGLFSNTVSQRMASMLSESQTFIYSGKTGETVLHFYSQLGVDGEQIEYCQLTVGASSVAHYEEFAEDAMTLSLPDGFAGGILDVTGGKITTKLGKTILDGTETWKTYETSTSGIFIMHANGAINEVDPPLKNSETAANLMCTHYKVDSIDSAYMCRIGIGISPSRDIHLYDPNYQDVDTWKANLVAKYAEGNPITIYYKLAEPIITSDVSQLIPAISGVNTITTNAASATVTGAEDPKHTIDKLTNAIISLGGNV